MHSFVMRSELGGPRNLMDPHNGLLWTGHHLLRTNLRTEIRFTKKLKMNKNLKTLSTEEKASETIECLIADDVIVA